MPISNDPTRMDLHEIHAAYADGRLDPVQVLRAHLERVHAVGPSLRCIITPLDAMALEQAQFSAARWRAGRPLGVLDGIPVGLKDNIAVAGVRCTAGTAALAGWVPDRDAAVVRLLREAGAVLVAKLNLHEAALGATNANPVYGDCQNPLRAGFSPGGSSGGSAAAVAAGLCTVALGTDTMGSVRIPAAYCGLFGYKPSLGEVPLEGIVPLSPTLDSCGPLARSVRDALVVAAVLRGAKAVSSAANTCDVRSSTPVDSMPGISEVLSSIRATAGGLAPARPLRIGVPSQVAQVALHPDVLAAWQAVQQELSRIGQDVRPVQVPAWDPVALRRAAWLLSEVEGHDEWSRRIGPDLPGLSAGLVSMLRFPQTLSVDKRERARANVLATREQARRVFDEVDLLLMPTTPQPAFRHGGPTPPDQADFTTLANVLGAAAMSFPVVPDGAAATAMPVACQLLSSSPLG